MGENDLDQNVFVYGTLRSTERNHELLQKLGCMFVSKAQIRGEVLNTDLGIPFLMEGLGLVDGEVYATNEQGLRQLDYFEGHPTFYERREVQTESGIKVWVYFGTGVQAYYQA